MNRFAQLLSRWSRSPQPSRATARSHTLVPRVEALESRDMFSTVLASGLDGLFGSTVGPDGNLYVTEQTVGRISRINPDTGQVTTFATGLPSDSPYAGLGGGLMDIAFLGDTAYVLTSAVGPDYEGGNPSDVVGIYRIDGPSSFTVVADIGAWSKANPAPPDIEIFDPTGAQYALQPYRGGFLVTDGHYNRVLYVKPNGQITQLLQFGNVVPTGLEVRGNKAYVAQAGPIPHDPETGIVLSFTPGSPVAPALVAAGAPLLVDVEFGPANTLYALAQGHWSGPFEGYPADPNTGSLVRANDNGTFTVIETDLNQPTSVEFIGNNAFVVGLSGEVVKIDVSRRATNSVLGVDQAALTDPSGHSFGAAFALAAVRRADGSAEGTVNFNFGPAFGRAWGAVPGVNRIHLFGRITSYTVAVDGTVTLDGRLTEKDYASEGGAVFIEENVPFRIVLRPGSMSFTLQWRELPTFGLDVTHGILRVR
jgi:hypothetical protein